MYVTFFILKHRNICGRGNFCLLLLNSVYIWVFHETERCISYLTLLLQLHRQPFQFTGSLFNFEKICCLKTTNHESSVIMMNSPSTARLHYVKQVNGAWVTRGRGQDSRKILSLPAFCKFGSWEIKFLSLWLGHIWKSSKISQCSGDVRCGYPR